MLHEGIAKTFIAQFICTQCSMSKCLGKLDFEVRPTKMSGTLAGMRAQFCCTNGVQKHRHAQLLHWVAVHTLDRGVAVGTFMLLLAVIPAVVLFAYIYGKDTTEKEPPKLLLSLFLLGALTTAGASIIEIATSSLLSMFLSPNSTIYQLIENFLLVAFVEELGKYLALRARTWNDPQFNYTYDAVVYAVIVSLGFATLENILYLMDASLVTAVARGVLSVPGHAIDGVFMGFFYGLAKRAERQGDTARCKTNLRLALVAPVVIHGLYDFYLSAELLVVFLVFEVAITTAAILYVRRLSREDTPL